MSHDRAPNNRDFPSPSLRLNHLPILPLPADHDLLYHTYGVPIVFTVEITFWALLWKADSWRLRAAQATVLERRTGAEVGFFLARLEDLEPRVRTGGGDVVLSATHVGNRGLEQTKGIGPVCSEEVAQPVVHW